PTGPATAPSAAPTASGKSGELVGQDGVSGAAAAGEISADVSRTDAVTANIGSRIPAAAAAAAAATTAFQETSGSFLEPPTPTSAPLVLPSLSLLAAVGTLNQLRTLTLQPVRNMLGVLCMLAGHPALRVLRLLDVEEDGAHAAERPLLPRLRTLMLALGFDPWVSGGVSEATGGSVAAKGRCMPVELAAGGGPARGCIRDIG
ncbi:hypothetical protein Vafri_17734, partial [Volvox africanus]